MRLAFLLFELSFFFFFLKTAACFVNFFLFHGRVGDVLQICVFSEHDENGFRRYHNGTFLREKRFAARSCSPN